MATLYLRNGQYYVNYSVNGKRVRKSLGSEKRVAELYFKELQYRLFTGDIKPRRPDIPIDYFFSRYLQSCEGRLSRNGLERYQACIFHVLEFFTSHSPIRNLGQVTRAMISDYTQYRLKCTPKPRTKTVNLELTVLRAALNWAVDNEMIDSSPANRLKMLKETDSKKGQVINPDEVGLLLNGCDGIDDGQWFKDILLTFLNTGMRLGELRNLTWDDIDGDIIKIQDKPFWSPKSYCRTIPINQTVHCILASLREHQTGAFVFTWGKEQIPKNLLRQKFIRLAKKVGLPHLSRIHDLRHTFASNLLMHGVPIPTVQALLGHKSWDTTIIYSHQTNEHTKEAVNCLCG